MTKELRSEVAKLREENERLSSELKAAKAAASLAQNSAAPRVKGPAQANTADGGASLASSLAAQIEKALSQQLGSASLLRASPQDVEQKYRQLLDKLALSPERKQAFLAALESAPAVVHISSAGAEAPLPENGSLKTLLSADEYAAWQDYEQSTPYRDAVQDFEQRLGADGSLTDAQRDQLVDIFKRNKLTNANEIEFQAGEDGSVDAARALDRNYASWNAALGETDQVLTAQQRQAMEAYLRERAEAHERLAEETASMTPLAGAVAPGTAVRSVRVISTTLKSTGSTVSGARPEVGGNGNN